MATESATNAASPGSGEVSQQAVKETLQGNTPVAPEEGKDLDLSPRFAALAKRERAILQKSQEIARQKAEMAEQAKRWSEYQEIQKNAKLNPLAYLEAAGLTYAEVSEFLLNDRKLTPEQRVEMLEKKLQDEADRKAREAEELKQREIEQTYQEHKRHIENFVKADPDSYELIGRHGEDGVELVFEVIQQHFYQNHGRVPPLTIQEACKIVESELEKSYKDNILSSKKFRPKEDPVEGQPVGNATPPTMQRTLTNSALVSAPPPKSGSRMSDDESKKRAAALLRWT